MKIIIPSDPSSKSQFPNHYFAVLVAIAVSSICFTVWAKAGTLTPSALPGATMKTLQQVYDAVIGASFDSSATTASQTGSLIQTLKYLNNNIYIASSSAGAYLTPISRNVGIGTTTPITQFQVAGSIPTSAIGSVNTGTARVVYVQGRYAYVGNQVSTTFQVVDVSNPTSPVVVSTLSLSTHPMDLLVRGRYAYVSGYTTDQLVVIDVSNPAVPVIVGSIATNATPGTTHLFGVQGRYAYVSTHTTMNIYDVSNPASLKLLSSTTVATGTTEGDVQGRYAYRAASAGNSLQIFNISDPTAPFVVASISSSFSGPQSVKVQGRYAYVANATGHTLKIFDVSNPALPTSVGSVATSGAAENLFVQGRYVYMTNNAGGANGLEVFDVSDPTAPVLVGSTTTGLGSYTLFVQGRYVYVPNHTSSTLQIFDMGGAYIQQLEAGGIETGTLATRTNLQIGNDADIRGTLTVGRGLLVTGPFSATSSISGYSSFVFNPNGNVGIGNSSPDQKLDVGASFTASSSGNVDLILRSSTTNGSASITDAQFTLRTGSSSERFEITNGAGAKLVAVASAGNVGIGTTTPGLLLHIKSTADTDILRLQDSDGTCDHNPEAGSETVTCSSDERLKENIVDARPVLSDLSKFHIREYNVISSHDRMIGVIAQEVQQVFPDLVSSRSNGYLAVEQPSLWQLVKGIQELATRSMTIEEALLNEGSERAQRGLVSLVLDHFKTSFVRIRDLVVESLDAKKITANGIEVIEGGSPAHCIKVVGGNLQSVTGACNP